MNQKESEKLMHDNMSAYLIAALDARYVRGGIDVNTEECETNPIVAKKQKIADFYKSLDDDEKLLLGTILDFPEINGETLNTMRTFSSKENPCKDFEELVDAKFDKMASRISSKVYERMRNSILRDSPFHIL